MILIDTREQKKDYITDRLNESSVPSMQSCLSHGMDYLIMGEACSIGIQRKSGSSEIPAQMEALRSDILPHLKDLTENPVLLIEEDFIIGQDGTLFQRREGMLHPLGLNVKSYFNFINSVKLTGVDVVCTRNLDASIWWMISTHSYLQDHHYPKVKKQHAPELQAVGCIAAINSFGFNRAKKLLQGNTLQELFSMNEVELAKVMTANQAFNFKKVKEARFNANDKTYVSE